MKGPVKGECLRSVLPFSDPFLMLDYRVLSAIFVQEQVMKRNTNEDADVRNTSDD